MFWWVILAVALSVTAWLGSGPPPLSRLKTVREPDSSDRVSAWIRGRWGRLIGAPGAPWREIAIACDLLGVGLASGLPLRAALRMVVTELDTAATGALRRTLSEVDLGVDEEAAWRTLADEPGWGPVARDVARSVRSGMGLSGLLVEHARRARAEAHAQALVRARQAGVRGVMPLVLCYLPAFMLLGVVPLLGTFAGEFWS